MVRVGIAGIGAIAESYMKLFEEGLIEDAVLTGLSSRNRERVEGLLTKFHLPEAVYYKEYEEMLASDEVDAVILTTPHAQHVPMALLAMSFGKHVLSDKPLGNKAFEVKELVVEEKKHPHLVTGVLFNRRSSDLYQKVKSLVESGEMGELRRAIYEITNLYRSYRYYEDSSWRGTYEEEGGGVLMNQAIHQLDLLLYLTGLPKSVMAFMKEGFHRPMTTENDAALHLFYENGASGHFLASTHESPGLNRLTLSFTKGQIEVVDDEKLKITRLLEEEEDFARKTEEHFLHVPKIVEEYSFNILGNSEEHRRTIGNFIRAIQGKEKILCSFEDGLKSITLVNAAHLSFWSGEKVPMTFSQVEYLLHFRQKVSEEKKIRALREKR